MPLRIAIPLIALLAASSGCARFSNNAVNSNPGDASSQSRSRTRYDLEDLRGLIALPQDADEVTWQEQAVTPEETKGGEPKNGSKRLVAVLHFVGASAQKFQASLAGIGQGEPASVSVEDWFPAELIAKGQTASEAKLKGIAYPAAGFAKPPYSEGRLVRVEGTDYYLLEMYAQ